MHASFVTGEDPVNAYCFLRIALISPFNTTYYTVITPSTALWNTSVCIYSSYSSVSLYVIVNIICASCLFVNSFSQNKRKKILAMTYSPTKRIRSTIGAGGLNFCVRDGYRCDPSAIITRTSFSILFFQKPYLYSPLKTTQCITSFTNLTTLVKPSTY